MFCILMFFCYFVLMHVIFVLWLCTQASSEHPLAKAILDYALHFHFFGKLPSSKDGIEQRKDKVLSQWLLEAEDFSAVPGKGVQCSINGKHVLVSHR
jgi:P-type Cu+ transporter